MTAGLISPRLCCIKHTICDLRPQKNPQHFCHLIWSLPPRCSGVDVGAVVRRAICRTSEQFCSSLIFWFWLLQQRRRRRSSAGARETLGHLVASLGVWLAVSSACVSAGSSVWLSSDWTKTKWTERPHNTVQSVFCGKNYKGRSLVLSHFLFVFHLLVYFFLISNDWFWFTNPVLFIFQCQSTVDLNATFFFIYKTEISPWRSCLSFFFLG